MNEDLLSLIQQQVPYISGIRASIFGPEVEIVKDQWILWYQSQEKVQEIIWKYLNLGGKIDFDETRNYYNLK